MILSVWQFDESHTGANISAAVLSRIQEWEVEEKVVCILRDNASNMVSGLILQLYLALHILCN